MGSAPLAEAWNSGAWGGYLVTNEPEDFSTYMEFLANPQVCLFSPSAKGQHHHHRHLVDMLWWWYSGGWSFQVAPFSHCPGNDRCRSQVMPLLLALLGPAFHVAESGARTVHAPPPGQHVRDGGYTEWHRDYGASMRLPIGTPGGVSCRLFVVLFSAGSASLLLP